jgi:D-alanine-D-alanine ligase
VKKVLVIMHKDLVPPDHIKPQDIDRFATPYVTEFDVIQALKKNKYEIRTLGIDQDISPLIEEIKENKPHVVFNLLEQFNNDPAMDYHIVTLLELHGIPYTGSNPKGLVLARDKALTKKVLQYHRIKTPKFFTIKRNEKLKEPKGFKFPMIVKCLYEEASYGIAKTSVVHSYEKLRERVEYIQKTLEQDAIVEEFIEGKEYYIGVMGHKRLKVLPVWELVYANVDEPEKEIYTARAKWNKNYRKRKGIDHKKAKISKELETKIKKVCRRSFKALNLSGYARVDIRVDQNENVYILEVNPNPNISFDDEFAMSAKYDGFTYAKLIKKIISLAN